ncbi:Bro-N domain-containing protein [Shewanella sp.]|uniref:BRO-N domain-containing protein n=1 Tax=Shewanella sp. TaxID=50422 RepID=UPI003A985D5C
MKSELVNICYEGESGNSDIRTLIHNGLLHISLKDILVTLNKENREINENHALKSMAGLIKNQLNVLDEDEYISVPSSSPKFDGETEIFVTQPGLYRVLSGDKSMAGKRFQKWLYHEVIPSITKHGVYPPPPESRGSLLTQMAQVVAQNSQMIADALARQDEIIQDVQTMKSTLGAVVEEVNSLKPKELNDTFIVTVRQRCEELDMPLDGKQEEFLVAWCDNLSPEGSPHKSASA